MNPPAHLADARHARAEGLTGAVIVAGQGDAMVALDGQGRTLDLDDHRLDQLHHMYCAFKPLVGVAVLAIAERVGFGLDTPVCDALPADGSNPWTDDSRITLRRVLSHTAGLASPGAALMLLATDDAQCEMLRTAHPTFERAFSEYVAGHLLDRVATALGADLTMHVETLLLGPSSSVACSSAGADRALRHDAVEVPTFVFPDGRSVPMLSERTANRLSRLTPAFDGLMSARGMHQFYCFVLDVLGGQQREHWPTPALLKDCFMAATRGFDVALQRNASFAAFFMTDMPGLPAGKHGGRSVGHNSGYGPTFGLVDPESQRVAVAVSDRMCFGAEAHRVRSLMADQISDHLNCVDQRE